MRNLKEVLTELRDKEAEAAIEPTEVDPRVRAGVEANIRNAKSDVDRLSREYKDSVMSNVVIIGVKGRSAAEFAKSAEKAGAIAVDFHLINDLLVSNLKARAVGEEYSSDAHFKLLDELSKIRITYDIVQLPNPMINAYSDGIYGKPLAEAISVLLTKNYGTGLQSAITRREIGRKALASKFGGKKLPVILYNLTEEVDTNYIPAATTMITSDGKVTDNSVKKKLTEVRNLLNNKESQNNGQSAQTQEEV